VPDARVSFIARTAQELVVELSQVLLRSSLGLAADYPLLDFPAIHPVLHGRISKYSSALIIFS
jgi:hypothetical protein